MPVLSAQHVSGGGLSYETDRFTSEEEYRLFVNRVAIRPGDMLLTIVGTIGRSAIVTDVRPAVFQRSVAILRFRRTLAEPRYIYHITQSHDFKAQLKKYSNQSAQAGVYLGKLGLVEVPLPPLDEQRQIAAILDKADALRRKRKRALELLEDLTKSLFLEMFRSYLDAAPDTTLEEFAEIQVGFPFKSPDYSKHPNDIRLCRGANVLPGRIDWSDLARWPTALKAEFSEFNLCAGDIVVAMDRPWISSGFKAARISSDDLPSLLVQRVARIRPKAKADGDFLYAMVRSSLFSEHFRPTETTVPHISPLEIKKFSIALPPIAMRERFAGLCAKIHRQLAFATDDLTKRTALFSALQHRAFSGQL